MKLAKKLLLLLKRAATGWSPTSYLGRWEFTYPLDELGATYTEGNGTLTVTSGNQLSISGGKLQMRPTAAAWGPMVEAPGETRQTGLAVVGHITLPNVDDRGAIVGFMDSPGQTNPDSDYSALGLRLLANHLFYQDTTAQRVVLAGAEVSAGESTVIAAIARTSGGFLFRKVGEDWRLEWVSPHGSAATLYPYVSTFDQDLDSEFLRVLQLPAPFDTDYGIATGRVAGSVSPLGTTLSHEANLLMEYTVTVPSVGTVIVRLRKQDNDNCWDIRVDNLGGLVLNERVGGGNTTRGSAAAGTVSTGHRIVVTAEGTTIRVYSNDVLRITYASATNFQTATVGEYTASGTGGSMADWVTWPRTLSGDAKDILDAASGPSPAARYPALFNVLFSTAESAPMDSPYLGEQGSVHIVDVAGDNVSVSGGELIVDGASTWGEAGVYSDEVFARSAGLTVIQRMRWPSGIGHMMTGWTSGANADFNGYVYKGWSYDSGATALGARMDNSANSPWIHSIVTGDQYTLANVLRSYGRLMFVKHSGVWRTAWVDEINNGTNLRAGYVAYTAGTPGHVDNFKIIQLPAPFNTDYGLATDRLAGTISDGTLFTHEADCIIEWEVTTLATTNFAAVKFRAQNVGTDFWRVEAWDTGELKLREFIAGVGTVRATAAGGTVVSGDRILVVAEGETIRVYVNNVLKITYASAANFKTETAGEFQTAGTGGTVSDLVTWPRILSGAALEILDAVSGS